MSEWQPIETAPRDGTFILCAHDSGYVNILQFCSDGWWSRNTGYYDPEYPTHWMPLPLPPSGGCNEN